MTTADGWQQQHITDGGLLHSKANIHTNCSIHICSCHSCWELAAAAMDPAMILQSDWLVRSVPQSDWSGHSLQSDWLRIACALIGQIFRTMHYTTTHTEHI